MGITVRNGGSKWKQRTSAATNDYVEGARNPRTSWSAQTAASQSAYEQGVQESITRKAFSKGVVRAGDQKYLDGIINKGANRFAQGVMASGDAYDQGFAPFAQTLGSLTLPSRGRRGDPKNYERSKIVGEALNKKRIELQGR